MSNDFIVSSKRTEGAFRPNQYRARVTMSRNSLSVLVKCHISHFNFNRSDSFLSTCNSHFFPMAITSASLFSRDWRIHSVHDRSRSPTDVIDRRILSKNSEFNGCSTTARVENIRKKNRNRFSGFSAKNKRRASTVSLSKYCGSSSIANKSAAFLKFSGATLHNCCRVLTGVNDTSALKISNANG